MVQVRDHTESTTRQYALSGDAERLGWPAEAVEVIDTDLGVAMHQSPAARRAVDDRPPSCAPDWALGLLSGLGGLIGGYLGARLQPHLPERLLRLLLGVLATALAALYTARAAL